MNLSLIAKVFGWLQFLLPVVSSIATTGVHGVAGWLTTIGTLAGAIGIHAASSTGGAPAPAVAAK